MLYRLLVDINGYWKQIGASSEYPKLLTTALEISDNETWMIVEVKRYCSGWHAVED